LHIEEFEMNRLVKIALATVALSALAAPAFAQSSAVTATTATTTIASPLTVAKNFDLRFGTITRPAAAAAADTITIDADATGARTQSGSTAGLASSTSGSAKYTVTGESGRTFSVSTPASMVMANGGNNLTVTLTNSGATGTLTGGTALVYVGGSFQVTDATVVGAYTGNFNTTIAYN
jgi:hypothetical protein